MSVAEWIKKERIIWHKRFIPSLIAGVAVAFISIFLQFTVANVVLLASLGSSAAILTHQFVHRLTILRTVVLSYFIALFVSLAVLFFVHHSGLGFTVAAFLSVSITTLLMYLFDMFHPPAVSASLSFLMFDGDLFSMILVFFSVIVLLIIIKMLTYAFFYGNVQLDYLKSEFRSVERKIKKKL